MSNDLILKMNYVGVFCTSKNRVVKIAHSSFEVVLRTTKHMVFYPSADPH
jgi:hypothetical protein